MRIVTRICRARLEHVWAEAYVPNDAYRGAEEQLGGRTWLPLDPSVKRTEFQQPVFDFTGLLKPRVDAFLNSFTDGVQKVGDDGFVAPPIAAVDANATTLVDQTKSILADHGIGDNPTPDQLVGTTRIKTATTSYLPGSTPFRTRGISSELRTLPGSLNASVTVSVSGADPLAAPSSASDEGNTDGFTFTAPTRELVNKRITLAYVPATDDDAAIIDAYHACSMLRRTQPH